MRYAANILALTMAACANIPRVDVETDRLLGAEQRRARLAMEQSFDAFLAVSSRESLSRQWSVLTFFADGTDNDPRWRVRRASGDYRGGTIDWAASDSCPALNGALLDLEAVEAPLIAAPGVGWKHGDRIVVTADGASYWMLARDFQDQNISKWSRVEIDAGTGSPLGDWIDNTAVALQRCWTNEAPPSD